MSKVQDDEVGDGTTSVTVLAAELLRVSVSLSYLKLCDECVSSLLHQVSSAHQFTELRLDLGF